MTHFCEIILFGCTMIYSFSKTIVCVLFFLCSLHANADFVDVATVRVNGKMIRKVTHNSLRPYLISFGQFRVGDTLHVAVWTDHGAQHHAFVTIRNLATGELDTLPRNNRFLLTPAILETAHLISVTFIYESGLVRESKWDICKIIPDQRIEQVYASADALPKLLLALKTKKAGITSPILKDSVLVGWKLLPTPGGVMARSMTGAVSYAAGQLYKVLQLTPAEKRYLERFNAVDYVQMYDFETNFHGNVLVDALTLDTFRVSFGDFTYQLLFDFAFDGAQYQLAKISYEKR